MNSFRKKKKIKLEARNSFEEYEFWDFLKKLERSWQSLEVISNLVESELKTFWINLKKTYSYSEILIAYKDQGGELKSHW